MTWPCLSHPCQLQVGLGCNEKTSYFRNKRPLVVFFPQGAYHLHKSTMVIITKWIRNSFQLDRKCPTAVSLATLSLELTLYSVHPWEPGAIPPRNVKVPKVVFHLKETLLFSDSSCASFASFFPSEIMRCHSKATSQWPYGGSFWFPTRGRGFLCLWWGVSVRVWGLNWDLWFIAKYSKMWSLKIVICFLSLMFFSLLLPF